MLPRADAGTVPDRGTRGDGPGEAGPGGAGEGAAGGGREVRGRVAGGGGEGKGVGEHYGCGVM